MRRAVALWVIWYAVSVHLTWAVVGLVMGRVPLSTPTAFMSKIGPAGSWLLVFVALLATLDMVFAPARRNWWSPALIAPQQLLLLLSSSASVLAVITGRYADGTPRAHLFILCDQAHNIMLAPFHLAAVLELHGVSAWLSTHRKPRS